MNNYSALQIKVSMVLKVIVFISACVGTFLSVYSGRNTFMGGTNVFMYFTIQSNIALAIISAIGAMLLLRKQINPAWEIIKFVGTVSITLTGIVFCFVLAPTLGDAACNPKNILTHVVVPVASIVDFFVVGKNFNIGKKNIFYVIVPPALYAIYAGIAYVNGWQFSEGKSYPYFFLNWGSPAGAFGFTSDLPFMGCGWWILALFVFLMLVGLLYLWIVDRLKRMKEGHK